MSIFSKNEILKQIPFFSIENFLFYSADNSFTTVFHRMTYLFVKIFYFFVTGKSSTTRVSKPMSTVVSRLEKFLLKQSQIPFNSWFLFFFSIPDNAICKECSKRAWKLLRNTFECLQRVKSFSLANVSKRCTPITDVFLICKCTWKIFRAQAFGMLDPSTILHIANNLPSITKVRIFVMFSAVFTSAGHFASSELLALVRKLPNRYKPFWLMERTHRNVYPTWLWSLAPLPLHEFLFAHLA